MDMRYGRGLRDRWWGSCLGSMFGREESGFIDVGGGFGGKEG